MRIFGTKLMKMCFVNVTVIQTLINDYKFIKCLYNHEHVFFYLRGGFHLITKFVSLFEENVECNSWHLGSATLVPAL